MNKVIEKYDGKTIRISGNRWRIQVREPSSPPVEVILERQDDQVSSAFSLEDYDANYKVWQRAADIASEIENAQEVDLE